MFLEAQQLAALPLQHLHLFRPLHPLLQYLQARQAVYQQDHVPASHPDHLFNIPLVPTVLAHPFLPNPDPVLIPPWQTCPKFYPVVESILPLDTHLTLLNV
jgi:hypothetical protein